MTGPQFKVPVVSTHFDGTADCQCQDIALSLFRLRCFTPGMHWSERRGRLAKTSSKLLFERLMSMYQHYHHPR